jgi:archaellum component FlaC
MTSEESHRGGAVRAGVVRAGVRRLTEVPQKVEGLSEELAALRSDVARLRQDVIDLSERLPAPELASPTPFAGAPDAEGQDDGIELFAERMAVLEDGLDDVADRLEGVTRDGVNLVSAQLERLSQRVDSLASRPSLTQEQLEEILARVAQPTRAPSST